MPNLISTFHNGGSQYKWCLKLRYAYKNKVKTLYLILKSLLNSKFFDASTSKVKLFYGRTQFFFLIWYNLCGPFDSFFPAEFSRWVIKRWNQWSNMIISIHSLISFSTWNLQQNARQKYNTTIVQHGHLLLYNPT